MNEVFQTMVKVAEVVLICEKTNEVAAMRRALEILPVIYAEHEHPTDDQIEFAVAVALELEGR